jgi:hypothetical protein
MRPELRRFTIQRPRAVGVIILNLIYSSAHGISTHEGGVEGLQQLRHGHRVPEGRVEPMIVIVWTENHWHPIVNVGEERIWNSH